VDKWLNLKPKEKKIFKQRNIIAMRECSSKQEKKIKRSKQFFGLIKPRLYELEPSL
jgi:hypothetical protein